MSRTAALDYLKQRGYAERVIVFEANTAARLTAEELEALTEPAGWVDVTKLPE